MFKIPDVKTKFPCTEISLFKFAPELLFNSKRPYAPIPVICCIEGPDKLTPPVLLSSVYDPLFVKFPNNVSLLAANTKFPELINKSLSTVKLLLTVSDDDGETFKS